MAAPKYDDLFNPTLKALQALGGSGRNEEIEQKIAEIMNLPDHDVNEIHRGNTTKLSYRGAWARNYLKRFGLLENSERGVWSLTPKGLVTEYVDKAQVNKTVKQMAKKNDGIISEASEDTTWQDTLLDVVKSMKPDAFERLCQRILRESGFTEVTVEGRSGDGGIDGRGIYKVGGLISIRVIFQAKRYKDSVSSQLVREFKGTMVGRAEKGVLITTGAFTRDAKAEAIRDGSTPIDLVDGGALAELLKNLRLGVGVRMIEDVTINDEWFFAV